LDVIVVRKLGVPNQPELAMGAIGDGVRIVNEELVSMAGISDEDLAEVEKRERVELERRSRLYRGGARRRPLDGRVAIIVDDGIATGSTIRAAAKVAHAQGAARVVVAAPVAPPDVIELLRLDADEVVVAETPVPFLAISQFYQDFSQVQDAEVTELLENAGVLGTDALRPVDEEIEVLAGDCILGGHLAIPEHSRGMVVFAHGSGSSRHSPRNRRVAQSLNSAGLGTLLFDLLTADEEVDRANVFDIKLLAGRLVDATRWLVNVRGHSSRQMGYFGASTGAAAALWAASEMGTDISAVVSRGGRPDLAEPRLAQVKAPTLLIVGGNDPVVLEMNRSAQEELKCVNRLDVIPGAGHLFEESGALGKVADLAQDWFMSHFESARDTSRSGG
jgi:putative phosphoribosyl transferase